MKALIPATDRKTATLHDVARVAGVSLITASRALSNPGLVSAKTIARVKQAATATGYVPNRVAGSLKSRRSMTVACLVPSISVAQFLPTVQVLTERLHAAGYQVILGQIGYDHAKEEDLIDTMLGRRVDGIVMAGLIRSSAVRQRVTQSGTPLVETWELSDRPADMVVGFSHLKVGSAVAGYFLARGWERVGIATGDDRRAGMRREGFLAAWGRPVPTATVPAPGRLELGRQALRELLAQDARLQAVFCSSDQLALGVLVEAAAQGLNVPGQLAVCGFGDADFAAHTEPSLTTVHVDGASIGRRAAELILERCRGEAVAEPVVDLGFRIVERASTHHTRSSWKDPSS